MTSGRRPSRRPAVTELRAAAAPARLRASWVRSRGYGVSPDEVEPVFTGGPDTGSLLYECGVQVLQTLHATLADEPISLMIADRDGLVLTRLCRDRSIVRSLDRVHLAPGFVFSERNAGTNGLGLSLADRAPALVRAAEHYCTSLQGYTCAAAPVLDPLTGDLAGTVNLTTWSDSSSELLLALARSAADNTSALMLLRAGGRRERPAPRGEVFHVHADRARDPCVSHSWTRAVADARRAVQAGHLVAVVGEPGAGKTSMAARARREAAGRERVLNVRPPAPDQLEAWLALWTPEIGTNRTVVIASTVDALPAWAAGELARAFGLAAGSALRPVVLTAEDFGAIPEPLRLLVDTVVEAPPLRLRAEDVMPLAHAFAAAERHRAVAFTPAAVQALCAFDWPGNVKQLRRVVRDAVTRADEVDARHLPGELFSAGGHRLTRLETLERDEIVRCLTEPGVTVARAAAELGLGRATLYRKIAQYDIVIPGKRSGS